MPRSVLITALVVVVGCMSLNQRALEHSTTLTVDAQPQAVFDAAMALLVSEGFEPEMAESGSGFIKANRPYGEANCTWVGVCTNETMLIYMKSLQDGAQTALTVSPRNEKVLPNGQRTTSGMGMPGRLVELARQIADMVKSAAESNYREPKDLEH